MASSKFLPRVVLVGTCIAVLLMSSAASWADPEVDSTNDPYDPGTTISGEEEQPIVVDGGDPIADPNAPAMEYLWLPACLGNYPGSEVSLCEGAYSCTVGSEMRWTLWGRTIRPPGAWGILGTACLGDEPPGAPPVLTDQDVLNAVRRLGLPRLTIQVQPAEETLVNFETIFYANEPQWVRTVTLLGYTVDIEAEVTSYDWLFGDGTTTSTATPGAPYPAKDVVHEYTDAHVRMQPRVDVAYEITYRVDGGEWQTIDETVPAQGYATELLIREATPILVGD